MNYHELQLVEYALSLFEKHVNTKIEITFKHHQQLFQATSLKFNSEEYLEFYAFDNNVGTSIQKTEIKIIEYYDEIPTFFEVKQHINKKFFNKFRIEETISNFKKHPLLYAQQMMKFVKTLDLSSMEHLTPVFFDYTTENKTYKTVSMPFEPYEIFSIELVHN